MEEQKEKQQAAAKAKKQKMLQLEEEKKKQVPLTEIQKEEKIVKDSLLNRVNEEKLSYFIFLIPLFQNTIFSLLINFFFSYFINK